MGRMLCCAVLVGPCHTPHDATIALHYLHVLLCVLRYLKVQAFGLLLVARLAKAGGKAATVSMWATRPLPRPIASLVQIHSIATQRRVAGVRTRPCLRCAVS